MTAFNITITTYPDGVMYIAFQDGKEVQFTAEQVEGIQSALDVFQSIFANTSTKPKLSDLIIGHTALKLFQHGRSPEDAERLSAQLANISEKSRKLEEEEVKIRQPGASNSNKQPKGSSN